MQSRQVLFIYNGPCSNCGQNIQVDSRQMVGFPDPPMTGMSHVVGTAAPQVVVVLKELHDACMAWEDLKDAMASGQNNPAVSQQVRLRLNAALANAQAALR